MATPNPHACPYCGTEPTRLPQRRFVCDVCQHRVAVRAVRGLRLPVLMTEEAAVVYDRVTRGAEARPARQLIELATALACSPEAGIDALALDWLEQTRQTYDMVSYAEERGLDLLTVHRRRIVALVREAALCAPADAVLVVQRSYHVCRQCRGLTGTRQALADALDVPVLPHPDCERLTRGRRACEPRWALVTLHPETRM